MRLRMLVWGCFAQTMLLCGCSTRQEEIDSTISFNRDANIRTKAIVLIPELSIVELDPIKHGGKKQKLLRVLNDQSSKITLNECKTSCECVEVSNTPITIEPKCNVILNVGVDTSHDPDFRGSLDVEVVGIGEDGREVLQFRVHFKVIE